MRSQLNNRLPKSVKVGYITVRIRFSPSFTRTRRLVRQHQDFLHRLFTAGSGMLFFLMGLMGLTLLTQFGLLPATDFTTLAGTIWGVSPVQFSLAGVLILLGAVMVIIIPHEMGHVIASFVYGAEVEQVGIILLFGFLPVIAYVRNSEEYREQRPHAQLRVSAGGITMQMLLALLLLPPVLFVFGGIPTPETVSTFSYTTATLFITVLFYLNIELAFLNAIPFDILDGGSAYNALASITDEYVTGTPAATSIYRGFMTVKNAALLLTLFILFT